MDIVTPGLGLIFWSTLIFILLLLLLKKFAWKPMLDAVNNREQSIKKALESAEEAKKEMQNLKADNDRIIAEARKERETLLTDARKMKEQILSQAKDEAKEEATKIIAQAKTVIDNEKKSALKELKNQVANISIDIAKKVIEKELSDDKKQLQYAEDILKEVNLKIEGNGK